MDNIVRRLELLKLEGLGFSQAEIVRELSQKAECSARTIYSDFETRASWQPLIQSVLKSEDILMKIVNRYEQIYRQASICHLTSGSELVKLGALNIMLKANTLLFQTVVLPEITNRLQVLEKRANQGVFVP